MLNGAEFTSKRYDLQGRMPLFLRAAAVRDSDLRQDVRSLREIGVGSITITRMRRTPQQVRTILHEEDHQFIDKALKKPAKNENKQISGVRLLVDESIKIDSSHPTKRQQEILSRINTSQGIRWAKEGYALRRFSYDRPASELRTLSYIGAVSVMIAGVATGLELKGIKGWGLLAAQSADDVGNAAITTMTEKRMKTTRRQRILKMVNENWPVAPVLAGAAFADNLIIPQLLESPNNSVKLCGGLLFSLSAVGGSVCVNILQGARRRKKIKEQPEGTILAKQHPFNSALWVGVGLSAIASEVAASKGILLGHVYSGTLQTVIGQLETITAFAGLYGANAIANVKEHVNDWLTVKRAEKARQIFPEEK